MIPACSPNLSRHAGMGICSILVVIQEEYFSLTDDQEKPLNCRLVSCGSNNMKSK
jgi:hypothetical protein